MGLGRITVGDDNIWEYGVFPSITSVCLEGMARGHHAPSMLIGEQKGHSDPSIGVVAARGSHTPSSCWVAARDCHAPSNCGWQGIMVAL